ncbi:MAG: hypothetical protein JWP74_550 [Marmoricola sp.]|nr:hypothetical protein [Marmoricola sp.]
MSRLTTIAALAGVLSGGILAATAGSALAAGQDGVLNDGEAGFYYNSGCVNSMSDFATARSNLAGYEFLSSGAGKGQAVKNNTACVANARLTANLRVYYNSGYQGVNDLIPAGEYGNLSNTYNENASFKWI